MHNDTKGESLQPTDVKVKHQVPGITTEREKAMAESELKNQELFYRAMGR
jgi:hypothetical protein